MTVKRQLNDKRAARRLRTVRKRSAPGASPGTIIPDPQAKEGTLSLLAYSEGDIIDQNVSDLSLLDRLSGRSVWLDLDGLGNASLLHSLAAKYAIHPLVLEDLVNTHQRAKLEVYNDLVFLVARMPVQGRVGETEQVSFILKEDVLLTFQEVPGGDPFLPVRERLRQGRGKIRSRSVDYLMYALLDALVDSYFPVLELISDRLDEIEAATLSGAEVGISADIFSLKQDVMAIRRAVWPLRDVLHQLSRDKELEVGPETQIYLRDCYDHTLQIMELLDTYRELVGDLRDTYHSEVNNKMNKSVRFLSAISTIFMPLTLIAGIYGMNFDPAFSPYNMPELQSYYGYPLFWAVIIGLSALLCFAFKRKGWL